MSFATFRGLLLFLCWVPAALGSLVLSSSTAVSGTGLGSVPTLLTIQAQSIETGCVSPSGVGDAFNNLGVCTGTGADVKTSQSQVRSLLSGSVTSAADFAIIFNANQTSGGPITITNLQVTFYTPTGGFLYQTNGFSCPSVPNCDFLNSQSGTGSSGFPFSMDAKQQSEATAAGVFANTANLVGVAASFSQTNGGAETLYLAHFAAPPTGVPEPKSSLLALSGGLLLFLGVAWKRRTSIRAL